MKTEDVHNTLPNSELRNLLSKLYRKAEKVSCYSSVEYLEERVKEYQKMLENARICIAINQMMKELGWQEWDISDQVEYDENDYIGLFGTPKEFKEIMKKQFDIDIKLKHRLDGKIEYEIIKGDD